MKKLKCIVLKKTLIGSFRKNVRLPVCSICKKDTFMIFPTCIIDILHVFVSSDTIHEVRLAEDDKESMAKLSYFFSCFGSGEKIILTMYINLLDELNGWYLS